MTLPKLRLRLVAISGFAILILLVLSFLHTETVEWFPLPDTTYLSDHVSRLHLLVVATNSNLNLCRLILSGTILSYPPPVLIDWEGAGEFNATESHLAKIAGPLRYLEALPPHKDNDIVLLVDGYDVIFQLGPDVLLQRYFSAIRAADVRLKAQFGAAYVEEHGIHNSIIFGPDKTCFPLDHRHSRCWAVPTSPLPSNAFGPDTDTDMEHHRPRWINSGTIMGPAADLRELFRATRDKVLKTFDPENNFRNSDQMYLADVFADQEYARTVTASGPLSVADQDERLIPNLEDGHKTEFHVGIDYDSRMFQTCAGYENYLNWVTFDTSNPHYELETVTSEKIGLQEDISLSRRPFALISDDKQLSSTPWTHVPLGVNMVTGFTFPILHFTSDKSLRDRWWPQMWFFTHAERLLIASRKVTSRWISDRNINGIRWQKDMPYEIEESEEEKTLGAWSDLGDQLSWGELCKAHEETLYNG